LSAIAFFLYFLEILPFFAALVIIFVFGYKKYKMQQAEIPPEKRKRPWWKRLKW
jgi:hypothetical protein